MGKFPLSTVVVFLSVVIMCGLSAWQISRGFEKQARIDHISRVTNEPDHWMTLVEETDNPNDIPVRLTGTFDHDSVMLLDNRMRNGKVGYEVIVPFLTQYGWVVTNLGWVLGDRDRSVLPAIELPENTIEIEGRIQIPTVNPMVRETLVEVTQWPAVVQAIDLEKMSRWTDRQLVPFSVVVTGDALPQFDSRWQPVVMPPMKHFGYALQWLLLAIAAAWIYIKLVLSQSSKQEQDHGTKQK